MTTRLRFYALSGLLVPVFLAVCAIFVNPTHGQAVEEAVVPEAANSSCPVEVGEPIDPEQWVDYEGRRVYLCCRRCKRKFEADPVAYLDNLPALAVTASAVGVSDVSGGSTGHPHTEAEHGHGSTASVEVETTEHEHAGHSHEHDQEGLSRLTEWLGKFHPASTDLPVGLLIGAAIAELLALLTGRSIFSHAARYCVVLGGIGAIGAATLGWFYAGFALSDGDWLMTLHRWLGTGIGVWSLLLIGLSVPAYREDERGQRVRVWFRLALWTGAVLVMANGFFGGALVYGLDHYRW
ncbi:MAG: hypothetical protein Kow00105_13030 [Phycisphaeraceae bacterium]